MEEKKIFDPKFVHFMWDDSLEGKEGFYSDSISNLIGYVETNYLRYKGCAKRNCVNDSYPFNMTFDGGINNFKFFYYDPNYECKVVYTQGKTIQCRKKGEDKWMVTSNPNWLDKCEYRVKPDEYRVVCCPDGKVNVCECDNMPCYAEDFRGTKEQCLSYAAEHYCQLCKHFNDNCSTDGACMGFLRKKKWRPFKDIAELKNTFLNMCYPKGAEVLKNKFMEPEIWVRKKEVNISYKIERYDYRDSEERPIGVGGWMSLQQLFDEYEFLDGTPCGVEE